MNYRVSNLVSLHKVWEYGKASPSGDVWMLASWDITNSLRRAIFQPLGLHIGRIGSWFLRFHFAYFDDKALQFILGLSVSPRTSRILSHLFLFSYVETLAMWSAKLCKVVTCAIWNTYKNMLSNTYIGNQRDKCRLFKQEATIVRDSMTSNFPRRQIILSSSRVRYLWSYPAIAISSSF